MEYKFRRACERDLVKINELYERIKFLPSTLKDGEVVWVGECDSGSGQDSVPEIVALGRIHPVGSEGYELGGMFVSEAHRGQKLAKQIIVRLLEEVDGDVYCVPFEHLIKLYESFGFRVIPLSDDLPKKLLEKVSYCGRSYSAGCVVMRI